MFFFVGEESLRIGEPIRFILENSCSDDKGSILLFNTGNVLLAAALLQIQAIQPIREGVCPARFLIGSKVLFGKKNRSEDLYEVFSFMFFNIPRILVLELASELGVHTIIKGYAAVDNGLVIGLLDILPAVVEKAEQALLLLLHLHVFKRIGLFIGERKGKVSGKALFSTVSGKSRVYKRNIVGRLVFSNNANKVVLRENGRDC